MIQRRRWQPARAEKQQQKDDNRVLSLPAFQLNA
jgi:hypothetical protein